VTKTQSIGPISCLKHRATRVLHCTIVTTAGVLMFPLLLQSIISSQIRPRRLRGRAPSSCVDKKNAMYRYMLLLADNEISCFFSAQRHAFVDLGQLSLQSLRGQYQVSSATYLPTNRPCLCTFATVSQNSCSAVRAFC